jgi:hypothetical protein
MSRILGEQKCEKALSQKLSASEPGEERILGEISHNAGF